MRQLEQEYSGPAEGESDLKWMCHHPFTTPVDQLQSSMASLPSIVFSNLFTIKVCIVE